MLYFIRRIYKNDCVEVAFGSDLAWRQEARVLRSMPHARFVHITNVTQKNACRLACQYGRFVGVYAKSATLPSNVGRARNLDTGEIVEMTFGQK